MHSRYNWLSYAARQFLQYGESIYSEMSIEQQESKRNQLIVSIGVATV